MRKTLVALLLTLTVATVAAAQGHIQNPKYSAKVKLTVTADPGLKDEFVSYVARELRSLQEVELVDSGADFELKIVAMETHSQGSSTPNGIAISTIVLRTVKHSPIGYFAADCAKEKGFDKVVDALMGSDGILEDSELLVGPPDQLKALAGKVVASFDQGTIEPMRRLSRQVKSKE